MQAETKTDAVAEPAVAKEKIAPVLKIPKDDSNPALVAAKLLGQEGFTFDISTPSDDGQLEIRPAAREDYEALSAVMQTPQVRALMAALSGTELAIDGFGWDKEICGRIETGFLLSRATLYEGFAKDFRKDKAELLDKKESEDKEESEEQRKLVEDIQQHLASLRSEAEKCQRQAKRRLAQPATGAPTEEDIRLILTPLVDEISTAGKSG